MVFLFLGLWGTTTVIHNGWTNLHSHQQCRKFPFPLQLHQYLFFFYFFIIAILTSVRWYLIVVLICIFLMISDVELISYACWLHVCLLLKSFCSCPLPTFELACLLFYCKSVLVLCKFWISALCQMGKLQKYFPILLVAIHSNDCLFCCAEAVEFD